MIVRSLPVSGTLSDRAAMMPNPVTQTHTHTHNANRKDNDEIAVRVITTGSAMAYEPKLQIPRVQDHELTSTRGSPAYTELHDKKQL